MGSVMLEGENEEFDPARPAPHPEFNACFSVSPAGVARDPTSSPRAKMRSGLWSPDDAAWMQLVQDNYEKHHRHAPATAGSRGDGRQPLIPRKIHHIWLGSPLPEAFARLRESWLLRHGGGDIPGHREEEEPGADGSRGWETKLWTDKDVDGFGLENRAAYDAAGNFGQKSDILRYEILLRHGGLYVDVDFLCLSSFDDLHDRYEFYAGVSNTGTFELNNGLVGCRPGHPVMRDIVNRIRESCGPPSPPPPPTSSPPSSSETTGASAAASAPSGLTAGRDGGGVTNSGGMVVVGDPLSALMGALAGEGAGSGGGGGGGGLLAGLLGGEDRDRFEQAVRVEPGSATETITKTGPGVFTRAVMAWMVTASAQENLSCSAVCSGRSTGTSATQTNNACRPDQSSAAREVVDPDSNERDPCGPGADNGGGRGGSGAASTLARGHSDSSVAAHPSSTCDRNEEGSATTAAAAAPAAAVMILPPSYLYPIPNNAAAAKAGVLIGDGTESGVHERAGDFIFAESLAVHLWGRSWQQ